jgi:hypothetical protein
MRGRTALSSKGGRNMATEEFYLLEFTGAE